jgi:serine/threonine-protein kinase
MLEPDTTLHTADSLEAARQIDGVCDRFEAAWRGGARPRPEDFLREAPEGEAGKLLAELIGLELHYRRAAGEAPDETEYRARFPRYEDDVAAAFRERQPGPPGGGPPDIPGYEVLGAIGHGGMGVVYKARHKMLGRLVALKVLAAAAHGGPELAERFRREVQTVARLEHPNIVPMYEAGERGGVPFYAMQYVEGRSLAVALRDGPLPPRAAAACLEQVARAMHHAHERGVVHRDLKPSNILLDAEGRPHIADFGLAKRLDGGGDLTRSGTIMGTVSYMPPEQAAGRTREVGPLSDVYALGTILYQMLTGRPPFRGETLMDTVRQVTSDEPVPPAHLNSGVPRDLQVICLKCLEKEPARRYPSAAALADDLRRFLGGEPIRARPAGAVERAWRLARRNRPAAAFLVLWVVTLLALLVTLLALAHYASAVSNARRASSVRPPARCASASPARSHNSGMNGTAAPGAGASGTSRRAMASHNSGIPAPVRAETRTASAA